MKHFLTVFLILTMAAVTLTAQEADPAPAPAPEVTEETRPAAPPAEEPSAETKPAAPVQPAEQPAPKPVVRPSAPSGGADDARLMAQVDANSKNPEVYTTLLRIYAAQGKHKERLKVALKAIQNLGGSANLYIIVGDENKFLGDYSKALISYQFALRIMPNDANIYNRIGLTLLKMSNFSQAEAAFKAAVFYGGPEGNATRGVFYNNLAVAYEAMKDLKLAYKYFQTALKFYPGYSTASDNLVRVRGLLQSAGISVE